MAPRLDAGGGALLLWQEKAAWLADANAGAGRTRAECVQRLRQQRAFRISSHTGHNVDSHNNRNEQLYAANYNLHAGSGRSRLNLYFQAKAQRIYCTVGLIFSPRLGMMGCHAIGRLRDHVGAVFAINRPG